MIGLGNFFGLSRKNIVTIKGNSNFFENQKLQNLCSETQQFNLGASIIIGKTLGLHFCGKIFKGGGGLGDGGVAIGYSISAEPSSFLCKSKI